MKDQFKSVFDADYQGAGVFLDKVLKPLFGNKLEVLPVAENNPTDVSDEAMKKARIKKISRVANIAPTFNRKPMEVFDITLEDRVDITRARVGIQQIIRRGLFIQTHAFMLFHAEHPKGENWRFSYALKLGTIGSMTDAKRFTYLFGENMHCRTAIDRFFELTKGEITDQKILDAFNVEALSNEFFEEYRDKYAKFVWYITGKEFVKENGKWVEKTTGTPNKNLMRQFHNNDKAVRDYVKKMMGRITFLHFLQKKGWMKGDLNYMYNLFDRSNFQPNYLEAVLEPLFFGILNTKPKERTNLFKERGWNMSLLKEWKSFPYLNGGLFEEDEDDRLTVVFPKDYFINLFEFYSRFNFTVDENDPDDAEVGVDPEMLGKIFENLLEDNKDKGAFYTPKEIVRYMCQESLTAYLVGKTGYDEELIRAFVIHPYDEVEKFNNQQQNAIYNALENVKICDPAIGSGAFPMGLLNELVRCEEALLGEREDDHQGRSGLKKYIIQNNIYGVDIEKGAIDIARLRFWLSIVVDEKEPSPLPNLDYKIMQGNSLLECYKGVDLCHLMEDEKNADGTRQLSFFDNVIQVTREELSAYLKSYFECAEHKEKVNLQRKIKTTIQTHLSAQKISIDLSDIDIAGNDKFFLWHTWFSDVFNRPSDCEKGFDIVIGNPPYIDSETMTLLGQEEMRTYIAKKYKYIKGNWDIYMAFMEQGLRLCPNGYLCFITPDKWLSRPFGAKFREFCMIPRMNSIAHTGNQTFKSAMVDAIITLFKPKSAFIAAYKFNAKGEPVHMNTTKSSSISKPFLIDSLFSPYLGLVEKIEASSKCRFDDLAQCEGACATHDAYELIPFVKEAVGVVDLTTHLKVVNTGTLSKFFCRWGEKELTYLGNKILHPVVSIADFKQSFGASYVTKSLSKKIIFKGLNLLDGFIDYDREYLPAKTTLVICSESNEVLRLLCGIINSELAIFYIKAKYASSSFCGGITFTKDMINAFPIPDDQERQKQIATIVSAIESSSLLEHIEELNSAVFQLYKLNDDDIKTIKSAQ